MRSANSNKAIRRKNKNSKVKNKNVLSERNKKATENLNMIVVQRAAL